MSRRRLMELEAFDRQQRAEAFRPRLIQQAREYGVLPDYPDGMDIWKLMEVVHREEDKRRWPEVKARAERLGLSTRGQSWKDITRVSLDCYAEERRLELERRYAHELPEHPEERHRDQAGHRAQAWRAKLLRLFGH